MAQPTVQEVWNDPDFQGLPIEEKRKVLTSIDSDFKGLPVGEQDKVLGVHTLSSLSQSQEKQPGISDKLIGMAGKVANIAYSINDPGILAQNLIANRQAVVNNAPIIGGIAGGMVGAGTGFIGSTALAGLGGAAGEGLRQIDNAIMGQPETNSIDAAKKMGVAGAEQAAYELGGRMVLTPALKVAQFVGKPIASKLAGWTLDAVKTAQKMGFPLSAGEETGSRLLLKVEDWLSNTPGGAAVLNELRDKQMKILQTEYSKLVETGAPRETVERIGKRIQELAANRTQVIEQAKETGLNTFGETIGKQFSASSQTMEQAGRPAQERVTQLFNDSKKTVNELYEKHRSLIPKDTAITPTNQLKTTLGIYDEMIKGNPALQDKPTMNLVQQLSLEARHGMTFERAYANRQALSGMIHNETKVLPNGTRELTPRGRLLLQMKDAIEADLEGASQGMGGNLQEAYQAAKTAHGLRQELISNPILKTIVEGGPEEVVNSLITKNNAPAIRSAKKFLGNAWKPIQDRYTAKLLGDGAFNPSRSLSEMRYVGDETLNEVYGAAQVKSLREMLVQADKFKRMPLSNSFAQDLLRKDPQNILSYIIKRNNTDSIKAAKGLIGEQKWKEVTDVWLQDRLVDPATGLMSPTKARKLIELGDDTLFHVLGNQRAQEVKALASIQSLLRETTGSLTNTSRTAGSLMSADTFRSMLTNPLSTTFKVGLPNITAKAYTSPAVRGYLTKGLYTVPEGAKEVGLGVGKATLGSIRDYLKRAAGQ